MVTITWMPATMPIWVISCWAALITPSSSGATWLEADEAVDGVDRPLPTPERASATRITARDGWAPSWVNTSIEAHRATPPATVENRSPTLTAA